IETKGGGLVPRAADAAADPDAAADHRRPGVDVDSVAVLPAHVAGGGVEAVQAVVAGADVDAAAGGGPGRLGVAGHGPLPEFAPAGCVEAVENADVVAVHALADVEPAVGEARPGDHVLHPPVVVEGPDDAAGVGVQAVDGAARRVGVADDGHVQ